MSLGKRCAHTYCMQFTFDHTPEHAGGQKELEAGNLKELHRLYHSQRHEEGRCTIDEETPSCRNETCITH